MNAKHSKMKTFELVLNMSNLRKKQKLKQDKFFVEFVAGLRKNLIVSSKIKELFRFL